MMNTIISMYRYIKEMGGILRNEYEKAMHKYDQYCYIYVFYGEI